MELKEQIGQLFMVGFTGRTVTKEVAEMVSRYGAGGVILFERNLGSPAEIAALTNALQALSKTIPLFIAVDQEGGRVCRLKRPFTQFPPAAALGRAFRASHSVRHTYRVGEVIARELKAVGITMDLAPVLDIHTNPKNPVIGDRALGTDPATVSELGLALVAGLQDNGVMACGKHFPGHGDSSEDSHVALPTVEHGIERLSDVEMRPFVHAFRNGLSCLMTAHVLYPKLDDRHPATLSEKIITNILRKTLGYKSLVMTDDLEMRAIEGALPVDEAAVEALRAGVDIPLICHSHEKQVKAWEAVMKAVEGGRLPRTAVAQSAERIKGIKGYFLKNLQPVDPSAAAKIVGCREHQEAGRSLEAFTDDAGSPRTPRTAARGRRPTSRPPKSSHPPSP